MRKNHPHLKTITLTFTLAFTLCLTSCGEESGELAGFVWIPPGTFWMGSPDDEPNRDGGPTGIIEKQHQVTLTKGFYMSKYQITQEQFYAIMGVEPANFRPGSRLSAEGLSWYEAIVFCNKLSIRNGRNPVYEISGSTNPDDWGDIPVSSTAQTIRDIWNAVKMIDWPNVPNGYRLPTEAEWEYACRGDYPTKATEKNTKPFGIGDGTKMLPGMANFDTQYTYVLPDGEKYEAANAPLDKITTVGSYSPNNYGLYDMHGNVNEWCWDWIADYPGDGNTDYKGPDNYSSYGANRVIRGGSWFDEARYIRSAFRSYLGSGNQYGRIGFRLVCRP